MKMEQTECSETSAYKIQKPENYPEESMQHLIIAFIRNNAKNSIQNKTVQTVLIF
jgi:hypothetical protein